MVSSAGRFSSFANATLINEFVQGAPRRLPARPRAAAASGPAVRSVSVDRPTACPRSRTCENAPRHGSQSQAGDTPDGRTDGGGTTGVSADLHALLGRP